MTYREIEGPIEGYKIFNEDMTCRDFKFEIGKRNVLGNSDPLELCGNGFHFCKHPSGVWAYYGVGRVFKVKAYGVLDLPAEPGADYKLVCREIEIFEEILITGDRNTGYWNAGDRNTGDGNTGNRNTGDWNTGYWNTGNWNTGYWNAGDRNTGNRNTGDWNTGDGNTGNGNCGDGHSGHFNLGNATVFMFNKIVKDPSSIDYDLIQRLSGVLLDDDPIDPSPYLSLPNATKAGIKRLHKAHIEARKRAKGVE